MRKYLKDLVELNGVSGREEKIRDYILPLIKEKIESYDIDSMGNIITKVKGKNSDKKIMVAAHMDEVGFLVTKINDDGTFCVSTVGGIDPRVVKAQRFLVEDKIPAIAKSTPIHLDREISKVQKYNSIKLYAGYSSKDETKKNIKLGDMVTFDVKYVEKNNKALCKAFDDRVGCSVMMDVIDYLNANNIVPEYDTYFCFVVQEETGLRGSGAVVERLQPDAGLILEGTTAGDNPENPPEKWATHIGNGPVLTFMHSGVVLDEDIYNVMLRTSEKIGIKYQHKMRTAGGTDAARLVRTAAGVPCAVVSVPCRYLHSPNTIIDLEDYDRVYKLVETTIIEGGIITK